MWNILKKITFFVLFFLAIVIFKLNTGSLVLAATQCVGSCCVTCSNHDCTHIVSVDPCVTHCDGPPCGGYSEGSYYSQGYYQAAYYSQGYYQGYYQSSYEGAYYSQASYYTQGAYVVPSTCSVTLSPDPVGVVVGEADQPVTATTTVLTGTGTITGVTFSSGNPLIASVSPALDLTSPYSTSVKGNIADKSTTLTAIAKLSDGPTCQSTVTVNTVSPIGPWWRAVGGDVITNQNLNSTVQGSMFILKGSGGFPGNAIYGTTTNLTGGASGNVSSKGWLGNTIYQGRTYNYSYFFDLVTGKVTFNNLPSVADQANIDSGTVSSDGYIYFKRTGVLNINSDLVISGNKKIVIFSDNTTNIRGNITIDTPGQGFFMIITSGGIYLTSGANNISGIYETDGIFHTGSGNTPLKVNGSVVAWGSVTMGIDLGNANKTTPAETFTYDPALTILFPRSLIKNSVSWQEVIP